MEIFSALEVVTFLSEPGGGSTALCPRCNIDSILADASGYPITTEFLQEMHAVFF
jgi:hypothetical protein